jgi:hypothetical protein
LLAEKRQELEKKGV